MREYIHQHKAILRHGLTSFLNYTLKFLLVDMVLHELSHTLAALAVGVSISEIGLGRDGMSPVVYVTRTLPILSNTIISYAGGLIPAMIFTTIFIALLLKKRRFDRTVADWTLGAALVSRIVLSLFNSLIEGVLPLSYLAARSELLSPVSILMYLTNVVAVLLALSVYTYFSLPARPKATSVKPLAEKA